VPQQGKQLEPQAMRDSPRAALSGLVGPQVQASGSFTRNLIHVAISRAMDNLNVFVMEEAKERVIQELVGVFSMEGQLGERKRFP